MSAIKRIRKIKEKVLVKFIGNLEYQYIKGNFTRGGYELMKERLVKCHKEDMAKIEEELKRVA